MTTPAAVEVLARALLDANKPEHNAGCLDQEGMDCPVAVELTEVAERQFAALSPADRLAIAGITEAVLVDALERARPLGCTYGGYRTTTVAESLRLSLLATLGEPHA